MNAGLAAAWRRLLKAVSPPEDEDERARQAWEFLKGREQGSRAPARDKPEAGR